MATGQRFSQIDQARGDIDQALLEHFCPGESKQTAENPSSDELSGILSEIEDIIDCLSTLVPSIRIGTGPVLTVTTTSASPKSSIQVERDTQLVREFFPTIDSAIKDRLLMAISWRWKLIATWQDTTLQAHEEERVEESTRIWPWQYTMIMKLTRHTHIYSSIRSGGSHRCRPWTPCPRR